MSATSSGGYSQVVPVHATGDEGVAIAEEAQVQVVLQRGRLEGKPGDEAVGLALEHVVQCGNVGEDGVEEIGEALGVWALQSQLADRAEQLLCWTQPVAGDERLPSERLGLDEEGQRPVGAGHLDHLWDGHGLQSNSAAKLENLRDGLRRQRYQHAALLEHLNVAFGGHAGDQLEHRLAQGNRGVELAIAQKNSKY